MALAVKKVTMWRAEVDNRPGALARTLEPLAEAGADLQAVLGYRTVADENRAVLELFPVTGKKVIAAARAAGLDPSADPVLKVEGDNKPGMGHRLTQALAEAGINLSFVSALVIGRNYSALFGFENEADATRASAVIKRAALRKK